MPSIPRTLVFLFICSLVIPFSVSQAEDWLVPGDLNNDQVTNHLDFFQLLRDYDPSGHRLAPEADLNSDLRVNHQDIHWALIGRHLGRNSITPPDPNHTGSVTGVVREDVGMLTVHIPIEGAQIYLSSANGIRMVDLKFSDLWGRWHHVTISAQEFKPALMKAGVGFDGSSVGLKSVKSGDMALIPDLTTGSMDPFCEVPTLSFFCNTICYFRALSGFKIQSFKRFAIIKQVINIKACHSNQTF